MAKEKVVTKAKAKPVVEAVEKPVEKQAVKPVPVVATKRTVSITSKAISYSANGIKFSSVHPFVTSDESIIQACEGNPRFNVK